MTQNMQNKNLFLLVLYQIISLLMKLIHAFY